MTLPMDDYEAIRASRPVGSDRKTRKPKRRPETRHCDCGVRLSSYNLGDACYAHTDRTVRRMRIT